MEWLYIVLVLQLAALILLALRLETLMDNTDALTAAVAQLTTDVDALAAKPAPVPVSVQPAIDAATAAVNEADAKVKTLLAS